MTWSVYIVRCSDGSLYTGVTTDLERRVHQHNNTKKAAKYTRSKRPVVLVWESGLMTKSDAHKLEYYIKKLSKKKKENLVANNVHDFTGIGPI